MPDEPSRPWELPHEPPLVTHELTPIGGHVGTTPEDFRVDEIPAYLPSGEGEHRYVRIQKRSLSTPEMVSIVARAAGVQERDIGTAGLKDKHAITRQWISMPRRSRPASEWTLPETITVIEESYHNNKLRTGHLHGNRFTIRLVELRPDAERSLPPLLDRINRGVANAFAEQRFGRDGQNIRAAFDWLKDPRQLRGPKARFLSKLYPSVIQSELFNRYLTKRLGANIDRLMSGEVVRLEGTGSNFIVEDLAAEQARYERGELHAQGPLFGPKMRSAQGDAFTFEQALLAEVGIEPDLLEALGNHAPGTRRDVLLHVKDLEATIETPTAATDSVGAAGSACLGFSLPAGCYATHIVRELTHGAWFARRSEATPAAMQPTAAAD